MTTKLIKDLVRGDRIRIQDPDGIARVTHIERSKLFRAVGGCWRIHLAITDGPNRGETIRDQHHPGDVPVELA